MAGLVDFAVRLGDSVLTLSAVQEGWKVVLNFTNLGFILGIIIIAFATIFHLESYALKQTLSKLIIAALLVNFSLVIAGGFMSISSVASNYFHDAALGEGGKNLSIALANAMNPQALGNVTDTDSYITKGWEYFKNIISPEANIKYIVNIFFIIIFTFLTVLAFATLFIMLLMRAMTLVFLLILSPIVWLLWIFPATKKYFQQWWQEFIRWNFFAPAVYFFIYLSVMTAGQIQKKAPKLEGWDYILGVGDSTSAAGVFNSGTLINNLFTHAANLFVVLGLLYGGIYVANKFGIAGGSIGVNLASKAGKGVAGWAGRKSLQFGTAPLRAKWFGKEGEKKSVGEKAVEWASKTGWVGRHTLGYAAKGITRLETAGGENILKQHAKVATSMSDADLKASDLTASGPRKIAVTKELQKRKLLGDVDAKNLITEGNKDLFGRFRQGVSWGDVEHGAKMNTEIAKQLRDTGEASEESLRNFVATYKGKDIEASAIKDLYSGKAKLGLSQSSIDKLGAGFAKTLAMENHQMVPKIIPTMSAKERANFSQHYEDQVLTLPNEWVNKNNRRVTLQEVSSAWDRTMSNYAMGFSAETSTAGTTPPPSTP